MVSTALSREQVIRHLLDRFDSIQQPATWSLSELDAGIVEQLRGRTVPQEVALAWTSASAAGSLAAHLRRHVHRAMALQISLRSCVVDPRQDVPLDLLARVGIRMLRPGRRSIAHSVVPVQPHLVRFGLWGLPVSCYFPRITRFFDHYTVRQVLYGMRVAAQRQQAFHLVFDVPTLQIAGTSGLKHADKLLDFAAQLRRSEGVHTGRLMDVERVLQLAMAAQPARSILRRVA
jgi:hypothetical protein